MSRHLTSVRTSIALALAMVLLGVSCLGMALIVGGSTTGGAPGAIGGFLPAHSVPYSAGVSVNSMQLRVARSEASMPVPTSSAMAGFILGVVLLAVTGGATLRQPFALRLRL